MNQGLERKKVESKVTLILTAIFVLKEQRKVKKYPPLIIEAKQKIHL